MPESKHQFGVGKALPTYKIKLNGGGGDGDGQLIGG